MRALKKCTTAVDRISKLPDDVILHIFSFLSIFTAGVTGRLSRRWRHLWKYMPILDFINLHPRSTHSPQQTRDYVKRVNFALKRHQAPSLQEFSIDLFATKSIRHYVAKWLQFAFSRRVQRLNLSLNGRYLHADTLRIEEILYNITTAGTIQSLKVLSLINIRTSGHGIQLFLQMCPMLEHLVIHRAIITSDLEIVAPSLKHFDIQTEVFRNLKHPIKVSAPNLTLLKIDYLDTKRLFLENVPKLANMIFGCRSYTMHAIASQLEILTISFDCPEAPFLVPKMPKLKKLVLHDRFHSHYGYLSPFPVTCFLRASPCLEEFVVEITKMNLEEGLKDGPIFRHLNLKRFKLSGFCGTSPCSDRIELVRYIVDNCVALEEIDISRCDGSGLRRVGYCNDVVDNCGHVLTMEERETFEKNMQRQLPAHLKLRIFNHFHQYKYA